MTNTRAAARTLPNARTGKVKIPRSPSLPEETLALQLRGLRIAGFAREVRFCEDRDWRFDFASKDRMLAIEVDGGTASGGRHVRPAGYREDCRKLNAAVLQGWRVLRFTSDQVMSGEAMGVIEAAVGCL